jgi:Pro-kumamolisin, activation domain/Bacterial Ig-like domain (group 3)
MRAIAAFCGRVAKPALKSSRRRPCVASRKRHRELGVSGPRIISLVLAVLTAFVFLPVSGMAQTLPMAPRITAPVDEAVLTTLRGNTHPLARPEFDQGVAPPNLPMDRMLLVLKRSSEQESALQTMLDQQHDKSSANYHRWLTPDEFGQQFGPADQDIQAITSWLQSYGFQVARVGRGRTAIEFSGIASQVRNAFHAEIHSYLVGGAQHWANGSDPQIPAALAPVVSGVAALNNFPIRPLLHVAGAFSKSAATGEVKRISAPSGPANSAAAKPQFTLSDSSYALGPADFGTIYNVLPLWKGNPVIDGTGQSIAIVGQSNINLQDVRDFQSMFGLPANDPKIILNGPDPGLVLDGSETEALLDTEWSGAIAPGAKIIFITSASTNTDSGADLSALYAVDNDVSPVLSVSFGLCELFLGTTGNQFHSALWEQAAAEGITVVVATGDSGSAGCDFFSGFSPQPAQFGLAVSGWASTPFNVAVGGTDFMNFGPSFNVNSPSPYWNASNGAQGLSAKGYVPESTWDGTCTSQGFASPSLGFESSAEARCNDPALASLVVTNGGSGGKSNCTTSDGVDVPTCLGGYRSPPWQTIANDMVRDLPDVSLFASDDNWGSFYIVCEADALPVPSSCNLNHGFANFIGLGGTSAAAPTFAAIMALVNQYTGSAGQGNANYELYKLASLPSQSALNCNSTTGPASGCVFNDVTFGTIAMPCAAGSTPDCTVSLGGDKYGVLSGYDAKAGYDLSTGLGSVNAFNLAQNWSKANFKSTITTLSLDNVTSGTVSTPIPHGTLVPVTVTVTNNVSNMGTPSGDVSLIANSVNDEGVDSHALSGGAASWQTNRLPGGSYNVHAHYPGDGTFGASDSGPIAVNVAKEASRSTLTPLTFGSGAFAPLPATVPYGTMVYLRADVQSTAPPNTDTPPTGTVTFTDNYTGSQAAPIVVPSTPYALNSVGTTVAGNGLFALSLGKHSVSASYSGDNSYLASDTSLNGNPPVTFTITQAPTQTSIFPSVTAVAVNSTFTLTVAVRTNLGVDPLTGLWGGAALPTGTVTLFDGSTQIGSATINNAVINTNQVGQSVVLINISASALQFGTNNITATYGGDTNYTGSMSQALTVQVGYPTNTVLTSSNPAAPVSANVTFTAQVTSSQSGGPAITGNVLFRIEDRVGTIVPLTNGIAQFTTSFAVPSFPEVNAEYSGDQNYIPSRASLREGVHDFTLSDNLGSSNIVIGAPGQSSAPVTLTISGTNGYTGTIAFSPASCVITPAGSLSSCSFSPSSVSGSGSTQLMINTTPPRAAGTLTGHFVLHGTKLQPIAVCLLFLLTLTLFNKQRRFSLVFGSVILLALFGLWACGGSSNATTSTNTSPGTPTGVPYTVTINAAPSGENSHTINLAFIVQ